ncbi:radical SAM protein [Actinomycetota bacterium Odt1-20B]
MPFLLRRAAHPGAPAPETAAGGPPRGEAGFVHSILYDARDRERGLLMSVRTAGDPVRCPYGEHPETWHRGGAQRPTAVELLQRAVPRLPELRAGRGLELTGGEPLAQPAFTASALALFKAAGVRTVLRTSGQVPASLPLSALDAADEVLLDLHTPDERSSWALHHRKAGPALAFARRAAAHGVPLRLSYLLVPGVTDAPGAVDAAARLATELGCPVEVRPCRPRRRDSYQELNLTPPPVPAKAPAPTALAAARARFAGAGLEVAA